MGTLTRPLPYRLLTALVPGSFRERHGASIDAQLRHEFAEHRESNGSPLSFWVRATLELARSLPGLWRAALRRNRRSAVPARQGSHRHELLQDLRYGVRGLRSRPAATTLCVVALTLGIGANTTVFTLANEIFLRPISVREPSRLVDLHVDQPGANSFVGFSYPEFEDLRRSSGLQDVSAQRGIRIRVGNEDGPSVAGQFASANHFDVLGVEAASGRLYVADETLPGARLVAVISHGFWQRRMGGTHDALGTTLQLDGHPATIIGILEPGYKGRFIGFPSEIWLPLGASETMRPGAQLADRANQPLELVGRLQDGVSLESAGASLNVVAAALEEQFPDTNQDRRVRLTLFSGLDESLRVGVLGFLAVLGILSALVLAAACLNVGSLLLASGQARVPEIATRLALGGSRARIAKQLLTETLILFGLGAVAATVVSLQLSGLLRAMFEDGAIPLGLEFGVDGRVLALTASVALATALATGLHPAWRATSTSHANVLRGARGSDAGGRGMRRWLVGGQVAVSVVLLVTAGLFLRALDAGRSSNPGFATDDLQLAGLTLPTDAYTPAEAALVLEQLAATLRLTPGMEAVGLGSSTPVGVASSPVPVSVLGIAPPDGQNAFFVDAHIIGPQYLAATGIAIVAGRALGPADRDGTLAVAVVSETLARQLWASRSAVGEQLMLRGRETTVVGVARDTLHLVQNRRPGPLLYLPLAQNPRHAMTLVMRTELAPSAVARRLRAHVEDVDSTARLRDVRPQQDLLDSFLLPQEITSRVAGGLGIIGLVLALTGIYGMVSFTAASRRRELGIRLALGAPPEQSVKLLLRSALALTIAGATAGLGISAALGPLLGSFLVGVSPLDPVTLVTVVAAILLAAATAAYLPARRAARIDPAETLREG